MSQIQIIDSTLCRKNSTLTFKEKLEIARLLDKLGVDAIELPEIGSGKTDALLVRTISSFTKNRMVSVAAGSSEESVEAAANALRNTKNSRIRIELPVSPVTMEYIGHKKPAKMLEWIPKAVALAKEQANSVEFCAIDATRAEGSFLKDAVKAASDAGADLITLCDDASLMLPDDFAAFAAEFAYISEAPIAVLCNNKNGTAVAAAALAVRSGVSCVKTAVDGDITDLEGIAGLIHNLGVRYDLRSLIHYTELNHTVRQIIRITEGNKSAASAANMTADEGRIQLDAKDDKEAVMSAVALLGYDLSGEDETAVYEEFQRVAAKKNFVGAKELDAIVISTALQVPQTYKLVSYVVNNGNIISASAQILLTRDEKTMQGISLGNGPIDAAFLAIEQIIGHRYELDDFQIQTVTEGKEAMGSAIVKLRANGKLYSGNGISTDIIGASIRAYLNAVNKIVYEEA